MQSGKNTFRFKRFQYTHPHGVRLAQVVPVDQAEQYFNPRVPGVRRYFILYFLSHVCISIHAPTGGATMSEISDWV